MNKKHRIYKKLVRKLLYDGYKYSDFKVSRIEFIRSPDNKKCSHCKFRTGNNSCRKADICIGGKVTTVYDLCSRNKSLNNGVRGRYILIKIEDADKTIKDRKVTNKI